MAVTLANQPRSRQTVGMTTLVLVGLAVLALVVLAAFMWITFGLVGLLLQLLMAGLIGALADALVPGKMPWGWVGSVLAGLVGSWLGVRLIGSIGPSLFGVPILPAFIGAVLLAFLVSAVAKLSTRRV
jgi:uncharacterized membrane protein YeaQ/YmgE (transglycosylase-associated protein family)